MHGVLTALVAFLLACLIWPQIVKNKPQFYGAFACVLLIILVDTLALMFRGTEAGSALAVFGGVTQGFLIIAALFLCVLFAGGMTVKDLTGDIKGTYEVVRRGETEKEVIIPLRGQPPKVKDDDDAPRVFKIDPETGEDRPA